MREEVTIIIPSYNPGSFLREALLSVYSQTYDKWKLYIIDDASTDDSLESIKDLLVDQRIKLIRNPVNIGQSKCMNIGLQFVNTPFFMQLDSDDYLFPDTLEILMEETLNLPDDVALIIGNVVEFFEDEFSNKKQTLVRHKRWGYPYNDCYEILLANLFPWQKFYRTSSLKKIGGWPTDDPYEGRHAEDVFVFLKLIENFRFHWIDKHIYYYRLHENNSTKNKSIYQYIVKWAIRDALKRWGDIYEPIFKTIPGGWVVLERLIPK